LIAPGARLSGAMPVWKRTARIGSTHLPRPWNLPQSFDFWLNAHISLTGDRSVGSGRGHPFKNWSFEDAIFSSFAGIGL
jgi:hypothetical protein